MKGLKGILCDTLDYSFRNEIPLLFLFICLGGWLINWLVGFCFGFVAVVCFVWFLVFLSDFVLFWEGGCKGGGGFGGAMEMGGDWDT